MDDNKGNGQKAIGSSDAMEPTAPQQVQQQTPQQPVQYVQPPATPVKPAPVGGMKEGAPIAPTEWVSASTPEVAPTQEVSTFVEVTPEVPHIPQAAQQAGVKHAKEATPVQPVKVQPINLSTPHPVLVALKKAHGNIKDSMKWLVSLIMKEHDRQKHTKIHQEKGDFFS